MYSFPKKMSSASQFPTQPYCTTSVSLYERMPLHATVAFPEKIFRLIDTYIPPDMPFWLQLRLLQVFPVHRP